MFEFDIAMMLYGSTNCTIKLPTGTRLKAIDLFLDGKYWGSTFAESCKEAVKNHKKAAKGKKLTAHLLNKTRREV